MQNDFEIAVSYWLAVNEIRLVFLLGCIHRMPADCIGKDGRSIVMYNIHPADPLAHGGQGMYGLAPHRHVLAEILDQITREQKGIEEEFFTWPTVHEVTAEYDQGSPLLTHAVRISTAIIEKAQELQRAGQPLDEAAKMLQALVLPCEHLLLPAAVNLACQRILVAKG